MVKKAGETEVLRCSFCNKDQNDVRKLIAGPTEAERCGSVGAISESETTVAKRTFLPVIIRLEGDVLKTLTVFYKQI